jgi:two-component system NarL family sensor kinase
MVQLAGIWRNAWQPKWLPSIAFGGTALAIVILTVYLAIVNNYPWYAITFILSEPVAAFVGGLIIAQQIRNPVGWSILVHAFCFIGGELTRQYAIYGLQTQPGSLPAAELISWFSYWLWGPGILSGFILLPLYFPTGSLPSPRWKFFQIFSCISLGFITFMMAFRVNSIEIPGESNPFGWIEVQTAFDPVFGMIWISCVVFTIASLILRYKHGNVTLRNQIKWPLYSLSILFIGDRLVNWFFPLHIAEICFGLSLAAIWLSIGVAILRYQLFNIDLLISRTILYVSLSALVASLYIAIVIGLGTVLVGAQILNTNNILIIQLFATGIIAVVFQPLQQLLQQLINRLLYGYRDDPYRVISTLNKSLNLVFSPSELLPTIAKSIRETLKLPYVAIQLHQHHHEVMAQVSSGEAVNSTQIVPLIYQHEQIGQLILGQRSDHEPFSSHEIELFQTIAQQVSIATNTVILHYDLQHSQERLVTAREEERRRLQRDLHDGLGPTLAGLVMQIDAAHALIYDDPDTSAELLHEVKHELKNTVTSVRQLVYQLWPLSLGQLGLAATMREHILSINRTNKLEISLSIDEPLPELSAALELAAYYILIEAINNVLRHAQASQCHIHIRAEQQLDLRITDNGVGLSAGYRAGIGLHSIRERAKELGGQCTIGMTAQGGTEIWVSIPREDQQHG